MCARNTIDMDEALSKKSKLMPSTYDETDHIHFLSGDLKNKNEMTRRTKVIIDTDAGIDDAQAILMILNQPIDVLAITTTHGNTNVEQVGLNVLRLLKLANRLDDIPVYAGCGLSFLGNKSVGTYHGNDGFGDVPDSECVDIGARLHTEEPAANAMIRIVNSEKNKGEVILMCIGPLTNLAIALNLDAKFSEKLKKCVIMGGNYDGPIDSTMNVEFNFSADPEAAACVFRRFTSVTPITLVTWNLCIKYPFTWEWYEAFIGASKTKTGEFLRNIEKKTVEDCRRKGLHYITCDQLAAAIVADSAVMTLGEKIHCSIELDDLSNKGLVKTTPSSSNHNLFINVELVQEIDFDLYNKMLMSMVNDIEPLKTVAH